jgi:putative phosphoribosyl transferase
MISNSVFHEVHIDLGRIKLAGNLVTPSPSRGIVLFSHGSGSSRLSPRNNFVASQLNEQNFSTLLLDLLTPEEDRHYSNRFDIDLLTERLIGATRWIQKNPDLKPMRIGYFGGSTGAASALKAAALLHNEVQAVVLRGGRPDLVDLQELQQVIAPTLMIVGERDEAVLQMNERAYRQLRCEKSLVVIPGATHLFEEAGALEKVTEIASEWFITHLSDNHE